MKSGNSSKLGIRDFCPADADNCHVLDNNSDDEVKPTVEYDHTQRYPYVQSDAALTGNFISNSSYAEQEIKDTGAEVEKGASSSEDLQESAEILNQQIKATVRSDAKSTGSPTNDGEMRKCAENSQSNVCSKSESDIGIDNTDTTVNEPSNVVNNEMNSSNAVNYEMNENTGLRDGGEKVLTKNYFLPRINESFKEDTFDCLQHYQVIIESITNNTTWHTLKEIVISRLRK